MAVKIIKNKKGIISTILVIQLIFMTLIAMTSLRTERDNFVFENEFSRIAAHKIVFAFDDISGDISFLNEHGADAETIEEYVEMVNLTTEQYFLLEIELNSTYLILKDNLLDMEKEGEI